VVTANAVSGTITIFSTRQTATSTRESLDANPWQLYPNPANDLLWVSQPGDYQVFNALGQLMLQVRQTDRITVDRLPEGTYLLRALDGSGTRRSPPWPCCWAGWTERVATATHGATSTPESST
jgi:hypothetical protein